MKIGVDLTNVIRFGLDLNLGLPGSYFLKSCFQSFPQECIISNENPHFGLGSHAISEGNFPLDCR